MKVFALTGWWHCFALAAVADRGAARSASFPPMRGTLPALDDNGCGRQTLMAGSPQVLLPQGSVTRR